MSQQILTGILNEHELTLIIHYRHHIKQDEPSEGNLLSVRNMAPFHFMFGWKFYDYHLKDKMFPVYVYMPLYSLLMTSTGVPVVT